MVFPRLHSHLSSLHQDGGPLVKDNQQHQLMQSAQQQHTPLIQRQLKENNLGPPLPHSLQDISVAQKHGVLMLSRYCDVLHRGASATGRRVARCATCRWAQDAARTRAARPRMSGASRRARRSPRTPWRPPSCPSRASWTKALALTAQVWLLLIHHECTWRVVTTCMLFTLQRVIYCVTSRHRSVIVPQHSVEWRFEWCAFDVM